MNTYTDDQLLELLREALAGQPAPDAVIVAARAAFAWRDLDAQLAALTYDSSRDGQQLVGVRAGAAEGRTLTFESGEVLIELETTDRTGRLNGQIVPGQCAQICVRHAAGSLTLRASAAGRFWLSSLPRGPMSLRCELADGTVVQTESIAL